MQQFLFHASHQLLRLTNKLILELKIKHWNIKNRNEYSLHLLTQRLYEELEESLDTLAEEFRANSIVINETLMFCKPCNEPLETYKILKMKTEKLVEYVKIQKLYGLENTLSEFLSLICKHMYLYNDSKN
jgi:DNA-binding ferritin-like protein